MEKTTINLNDSIEFKKKHPCGGSTWKVLRVGVDFKLECETCQRVIIIPRLEVYKRLKRIINKAE